MPKINVYLPDELAAAVRDAQLPVSAVCQAALERAVRDVASARAVEEPRDSDLPDRGLFGRFTPRAREALVLAEREAREREHRSVGTEHVLLGIIDEGGNVALKVLASLEVEPEDIRAELVASMEPPSGAVAGHLPFGGPAKRALEATTKEALALGHNYVGCEHLMLGLLTTEDGLASQVMRRVGLELRTTRRAIVTALSGVVHTQTKPSASSPASGVVLTQILRRLDAIEDRLAR